MPRPVTHKHRKDISALSMPVSACLCLSVCLSFPICLYHICLPYLLINCELAGHYCRELVLHKWGKKLERLWVITQEGKLTAITVKPLSPDEVELTIHPHTGSETVGVPAHTNDTMTTLTLWAYHHVDAPSTTATKKWCEQEQQWTKGRFVIEVSSGVF